MRGRIMISLVLGLCLTMPAALGCRSLTRKVMGVDTTKDIYEDDEAPAVQIYEVNGVAEQIPWDKVPPERRWEVEYKTDGTGLQSRVPIVKVMVLSWDKNGRPVPPGKATARVEETRETLNPRYTSHLFADDKH